MNYRSRNHRDSPWPILGVSLAFLVLRALDLAFLIDPETSFPTVGPSALRWGAALAAALLLWQMGRSVQDRVCLVRRAPLGAAMVLTGGVMLAAGAVQWPNVQAGLQALRYASGPLRLTEMLILLPDLPTLLLFPLAGLWFFCTGVRTLAAPIPRKPPVALQCILPAAAALWATVQQFSVLPAASARLACTFRVLEALGAMLCVSVLGKLLFIPGGEYGKSVRQCGGVGFFLSSCCGFPQLLAELWYGTAPLSDLLVSASVCCIGLCGLAALLTTAPRSIPKEKGRAG